ncbi:fibrobacter succinogenes major paralogous domain-containing protein [Flavobacteriaceae bacterium]|nr:fibrobacter succinogenes major paralogous domain-containing protein [Flavobacteriaceae bacterium]MDB4290086.1 fibrobacter succinogenes major paralogous domain-containing protein [Flavobacteriaceae bacterium]
MKKFYAILCLAIASLTQLHAQAPQGFNYQATVRNSAGDLILNTNVYFKFNVMQGSQTAVPIFTETHYVPTDDLGQVNLVIGQGTSTTGTFSELDWSLGSYYLGIELDTGSGYVAMGTTQLLSVPYALYAENSGNSTPTTPNLEAVLAENNSANNQQIKDLQDPTQAQDAATKAYIDALITSLQNQIDALQPTSVTDQDGNTYDYLTYGNQVWTVDNAEMITYRDGTPIPQVTDATQWSNLTTGAWCYYDNDPTKPRHYNWYAVMGIHDTDPNTPNKEFAPDGWHVPTDAEWTTLEEYLIANSYNYDGTTTENKIAKAMASTTGWNSSTDLGAVGNDQSLNNDSEFNAVPEGYRSGITSNFQEYGSLAIFWTSSENEDDVDAWRRNLDWDSSALIKYGHWKTSGISVRFVRD